MKLTDFDITLYDTGVHTTINSVTTPLVAYQDKDALNWLVGFIIVTLAQSGSLNIPTSQDAIEHFILHAQNVRLINAEFLIESFLGSVRNQPGILSPPTAPATLALADEGGGVVNASCALGTNADAYELWREISDVWVLKANGIIRGDSTGVDFQETGVGTGTWDYRIVSRLGFFASFPSASNSIAAS